MSLLYPFRMRWVGIGLIALQLLTACNQQVTPTPSVTAGPEVKDTPSTQGSPTAEARPTSSERTVEISALYFIEDPREGPIGGVSVVKVTAGSNPSGEFRVGFFESEVGGSGPMWRASGWMAATMSILLTGVDPSAVRFSYDVAGRIDGPSAGALMTVGTLAALRGDTVRKDAAMTGTINPDGTVGPVGGIPQKIEGAAKAGKKVVLIPSGQRYSLDYKTNQQVDTVDFGRRLGVEVKEVGDIYTTYEQLTGKRLARPSAAGKRPEVAGTAFDRMKGKAQEWLARYQEAKGDYDALPDQVKIEATEGLMAEADSLAARASRLMSQGLMGGAYGAAFNAALRASMAAQVGRYLDLYVNQGLPAAVSKLQSSFAVETKVKALADRLKAEQPRTLADAAALTQAYSGLVNALGLSLMAGNILQEQPEGEGEALEMIVAASIYYTAANMIVESSKDAWDVGSNLGNPAKVDATMLPKLAAFLRRAAEANLNLFENVVVDQMVAKPQGLNLEVAKVLLMNRDLSYAMARGDVDVLPGLDRYFGGGPASDYAALGGALSAYGLSTALLAKYYSLGAQLDENMVPVGFDNERSLLNMLDLADQQAQGTVGLLEQKGVDTSLMAITYEMARLSREGNASDKLDALSSLWEIFVEGRILALLGGFGKE